MTNGDQQWDEDNVFQFLNPSLFVQGKLISMVHEQVYQERFVILEPIFL